MHTPKINFLALSLSQALLSCTVLATGLFFISCSLAEPMLITYRAPESHTDKRYDYDNQLLKLALDKTIEEYGPYKLQASKSMNYARAIRVAEQNILPNFFIKLSYEQQHSEQMNYVPFPVDLGIVGNRVCFVSPDAKEPLSTVTQLSELRSFVHGQGRGWADVDILKFNGFKVKEINTYDSLFSMITYNRFDLFCRGVNELLNEFESHKSMQNLFYDTNILIRYPLPRFFYSHESNKKALKRIEKGLLIAYQDGSLKQLWSEQYGQSISFAKLNKRRIFELKNPFLDNLSFDYKKFFYDVQAK